MATLETDEANIIDAETTNWRLIVYPILAVLVVAVCGVGYYYYLQNERDEREKTAGAALVTATTPEEFLRVAEQYPHTDQATLAIMRAANASFDKRDYDGAAVAYRRIIGNAAVELELRDSAELGLASALEASGKPDNAIVAYLEVARHGAKSPYAPFAYNAASRIYDERGDKENERKILTEAASLDPDSPFTKQAKFKLNEMSQAEQPPMTVSVPASPTSASPAASNPAK